MQPITAFSARVLIGLVTLGGGIGRATLNDRQTAPSPSAQSSISTIAPAPALFGNGPMPLWAMASAAEVIDSRRSGCCSHHGGVCGCSCCDGSPLSTVCYNPTCGGGGGGGGGGSTPPSTPTGLVGSSVSFNQVSLTWVDNSTNETGFEIDMRTSAFGFIQILNVGANVTSATITGLNPDTTYFFQVIAIGSGGNSTPSGSISVTTPSIPQPCIPSHGVLCLNGGRFSVAATYMTSQGQSGTGQVVSLTDDTGYLWFFSQANVELVVKVLNGCGVGGHYWVFAGGLTDVEVDLTVIDTTTGTKKTYMNPQGKAFQPIQDTNAFATCP